MEKENKMVTSNCELRLSSVSNIDGTLFSIVPVFPHFFSCPCFRSSPTTESLEQAYLTIVEVAR